MVNPRIALCAVGALSMIGSCASGLPIKPGAEVSIDELAAHPDVYNGKHVVVKAFVVIGPENRNVFSSEQDYNNPNSACLGLDGPDRLFSSFGKRTVSHISGVFEKSLCGPKDVCLYWCSPSGIRLDDKSLLR